MFKLKKSLLRSFPLNQYFRIKVSKVELKMNLSYKLAQD